jgi:hypothetical protein
MFLSSLHKPWSTILLTTLVIAICMTLFSGIASAQGAITGSARFYGNAMGDKQGSPVTAEEICAWIEEEEVGCGPIQRGKYKIVINEPEGEDYNNQAIVFTIWLDDTQQEIEAQEKSAIWEHGAETQINLIFPGALANAVNKARSVIAGFISPNAADKGKQDAAARDSGNVQDSGAQVKQEMEEEKQRRMSEMQQILDSETARIAQDLAGNLENAKFNYDNEIQRLEQHNNNDGETSNIQYEIENQQEELNRHQEELNRARRDNNDRRYISDLERNIDELGRNIQRLNMNLSQAKSRGNSNISREKGNMDRQYAEQKMMLDRDAREQIARMQGEMQRQITNLDGQMNEALRQRQRDLQRQQGEEERMRREEEMREEQMEGQMQADERRFEMEEERMQRQMGMEEERMQRDLELQEERMRMEQEMRQRGSRPGMQQGMQPGMRQGPGGEGPESGPPQKRRGFLSNPKPGAKMGRIDNVMDPTMLAVVGIGLTILTTGVTLIRSK